MFKTLSAKAAAQLDQELMSSGAYSIDQLMELAGLAVAKAIYKQFPPQPSTPAAPKVLVLVGPGNNGGDGLVCARHLKLWRHYEPVIYYPKRPQKDLYQRLTTQLRHLGVKEIETLEEVKKLTAEPSLKVIVDSIFGFSFKPPVRDPFDKLIDHLAANHDKIAPIVAVDIPSGWDVDEGAQEVDIGASVLVSLTAPKPCAQRFAAPGKVHYLGGRFITDDVAQRYDIADLIKLYPDDELIVKL
ncbi:hypothetical protein FT663_05031 [Candidozyma haemuli var. vulneris]|nr:hypothetical protein FT662_05083 [[Candida] haemuloni var. vulneris]KAF3986066.1 hypothetical protein FT663_05031 [[Candida] haemuloni var. vulneris]